MPVTKESILGFKRKPSETVDVPEWGGPVHIGVISGADRHLWLASLKDEENGTAGLLARCIVDADGNRLFTDDDAAELAKQPADIQDKLWPVALRVNGMATESRDDAEKN